MAVSENQLSEGRLVYDTEKMSELVLELVRKNMNQAGFDAALKQLTVEISTVSRPEETNHWLSGTRPSGMPLVDATATWRFPDLTEYTVNDHIELVLD